MWEKEQEVVTSSAFRAPGIAPFPRFLFSPQQPCEGECVMVPVELMRKY